MRRTKNLTGDCQHCGMPMEFPAESIGTVARCPYCRQNTELMLALPETPPTVPKKAIVWTFIAIFILGLGLWGSLAALKRAQRWSAEIRGSAGQTNTAPAAK